MSSVTSRPSRDASLNIAETGRLLLRRLHAKDAAFILKLLNEPSWLRYIGDKGVTTLQSAERYIDNGPVEMYARLGFGLYLVELKEVGEPIGICGLIKRAALDDIDLGFAFLPGFWGYGYAFEAASAVLSYAASMLGISRIVAITSRDNVPSGKLLEKLGFRLEGSVRLQDDGEDLELYAMAAA